MKPLVPIVNEPSHNKYQCQLDWPDEAEIKCSWSSKLGPEAVFSEHPEEPNCSILAWVPVPEHIPASDDWVDKKIVHGRFSVMGSSSGLRSGGWLAAEKMAQRRLNEMLACNHDWRNTCWNLTGDGICNHCYMFVYRMFMDKGLQNTRLLAYCAHEGQKRKYSDSDYIVHPQEVYEKVNWWRRDLPMPQWLRMAKAAYAHDILEDCPGIQHTAIVSVAGEDTYKLVLELTNPSKGSKLRRAERKRMDREHLKTVSWEAKVIKFFDRSCNLRDLTSCDEKDFLRLYADESQLLWNEVFAPYRKETGRDDAFIDIYMEKFYLSWLNDIRKRSI